MKSVRKMNGAGDGKGAAAVWEKREQRNGRASAGRGVSERLGGRIGRQWEFETGNRRATKQANNRHRGGIETAFDRRAVDRVRRPEAVQRQRTRGARRLWRGAPGQSEVPSHGRSTGQLGGFRDWAREKERTGRELGRRPAGTDRERKHVTRNVGVQRGGESEGKRFMERWYLQVLVGTFFPLFMVCYDVPPQVNSCAGA